MPAVQVPSPLAAQPKIGAATEPPADNTTATTILVHVERHIRRGGAVANVDPGVVLAKVIKRHPKGPVICVNEVNLLLDVGVCLP